MMSWTTPWVTRTTRRRQTPSSHRYSHLIPLLLLLLPFLLLLLLFPLHPQVLDELGLQLGDQLAGVQAPSGTLATGAQGGKVPPPTPSLILHLFLFLLLIFLFSSSLLPQVPVAAGAEADADADLAARLENLRRE